MKNSPHKRHITKAVTWRCLGTLDTILLSWLITGNPLLGFKIGLTEIFTKMLLYYLHERFWFGLNLKKHQYLRNSKKRHILKTISWRVVGTLDTILISWFLSGNPLTGLKIGAAELVTKMILYYFHERLWYRTNFGLTKEEFDGK